MEIYYQPIIYMECAVCIFNVFMKIIQSIMYRRLIKDSADMENAASKIICNIKKQFDKEYAKMNKVSNVNMFVYKKMYEMRIFGIKISSWEIISIFNILICAVLGITAAVLSYINMYDEQYIIMHVLIGFVMGFVIILCDLISNMQNKMEHLHVNICEYFENTYIPMIEAGENVAAFLPYESRDIDEGIQELFRLLSEDSGEAKEYVGLLNTEAVMDEIGIEEKEEKILKDVFEEYLA